MKAREVFAQHRRGWNQQVPQGWRRRHRVEHWNRVLRLRNVRRERKQSFRFGHVRRERPARENGGNQTVAGCQGTLRIRPAVFLCFVLCHRMGIIEIHWNEIEMGGGRIYSALIENSILYLLVENVVHV